MITVQVPISPALAETYQAIAIRERFESCLGKTEQAERFGIERYRQAKRDAEEAPAHCLTCGNRGALPARC